MYTCKFLLELPQRKRTRPLYLGLFLIIKVELEIKVAAINKNDSTFLLREIAMQAHPIQSLQDDLAVSCARHTIVDASTMFACPSNAPEGAAPAVQAPELSPGRGILPSQYQYGLCSCHQIRGDLALGIHQHRHRRASGSKQPPHAHAVLVEHDGRA